VEGVRGMKGRREDCVGDDAGAEERMLKRPEESKTERDCYLFNCYPKESVFLKQTADSFLLRVDRCGHHLPLLVF